MFLKKTKISKKEFGWILRNGKTVREKSLILKYLENNLNKTRFGFLVSKKISKKATVRNKIKRQLRELARVYQNKLNNNYDLIFIVLPGLEEKKFIEIEEIFLNLLKKANLIKK